MTADQDPEPMTAEPKKPRRRFTPEERIANREAEIARIKERQREHVREAIDEALGALTRILGDARKAGMETEEKRATAASNALRGVGDESATTKD